MDQLFFYASKLIWMIIRPDILLVLFLILGLILLWGKAVTAAKKVLTVTLIAILSLIFFPVGDWVLHPLEKRFLPPPALPEQVDGVIMLAGPENIHLSYLWHQVELNAAAERYFAFMHLVKRYPGARHVFTGGTGSLDLQELKSTLVARQLFKELGVDTNQMIFESESKNTFENAVNTFDMVRPKPGEKWILVTSALHMPRSVGVFNKTGWQVIPYPVDHYTHEKTLFRITLDFTGNLTRLNQAVHEWTGLVAYYLTGKTGRLFPGP